MEVDHNGGRTAPSQHRTPGRYGGPDPVEAAVPGLDDEEPLDPHERDREPGVDRGRGAVYLAEDTIAEIMCRAHRRIVIDGQLLELPTMTRFDSLKSMQDFVDAVLADPGTQDRFPASPGVKVVARRGFRSASYSQGLIRIPLADARGSWARTAPVLLHEIAHHVDGQQGHGPRFRQALVHLYTKHLGPAAGSTLELLLAPVEELPALSEPSDAGASQLNRVAALLAKAQSTTNEQEAEAYLAKAALVAQRHSIDMAVAALRRGGSQDAPTHRMLTIGRPRKQLNRLLAGLLVGIAETWGVRVDVSSGTAYAILYGVPADLDRVESVYGTASTMMVSRAEAHVRQRGWLGSRYAAGGNPRDPRPVTANIARTAFCLGFAERLRARLAESADRARRAPDQAGQRGGQPGWGKSQERQAETALALRARDAAVTDYYRTATRARGTWRASQSGAGSAAVSRRAGRAAADQFGTEAVGRGEPPALPPGGSRPGSG